MVETVTVVTSTIEEWRQSSYNFVDISRLLISINHCNQLMDNAVHYELSKVVLLLSDNDLVRLSSLVIKHVDSRLYVYECHMSLQLCLKGHMTTYLLLSVKNRSDYVLSGCI